MLVLFHIAQDYVIQTEQKVKNLVSIEAEVESHLQKKRSHDRLS